jgi:hypothetical protein
LGQELREILLLDFQRVGVREHGILSLRVGNFGPLLKGRLGRVQGPFDIVQRRHRHLWARLSCGRVDAVSCLGGGLEFSVDDVLEVAPVEKTGGVFVTVDAV